MGLWAVWRYCWCIGWIYDAAEMNRVDWKPWRPLAALTSVADEIYVGRIFYKTSAHFIVNHTIIKCVLETYFNFFSFLFLYVQNIYHISQP